MTPFGRSARIVIGEVEVSSARNEDLRVAFNVRRSIDRTANAATVQVYNLSDETRAALDREENRLIIEAGYDTPTAIFCGNKAFVSHTKKGVDWVTSAEATDGLTEMKTHVVASYAPGVNAKQVLESISKKAGLAVGQLAAGQLGDAADTLLNALTYPGGKAVSAPAGDILEQIADDAGVSFSVQDCSAVFMSKKEASKAPITILSPDTGLIGTPERVRDKKRPKANLIQGECLILPGLAPHRRIDVQSVNLFGPYKINAIEFTGDTHGAAWTAKFEAESVAVGTLDEVVAQENIA